MHKMDVIDFDFESHQGRFRVNYRSNGYAMVSAYCAPDGGGEPEVGFFGSVASWDHDHPVAEDFKTLSQADQQAKYLDLFLSGDHARAGLEHPDEAAVPRVEVEIYLRGETPVGVVFRADKKGYVNGTTGWTTYNKGRHVEYTGPAPCSPFEHDVPAERITEAALQAGNGSDELYDDLKSELVELFWTTINPGLNDPWLESDDDLASEPIRFARGTRDQVENLLADAARLDHQAWTEADDSLTISARTGYEDREAFFDQDDENNSAFCERTALLVGAILRWCQPTGFDVEYNDGSRVSWSGYSRYGIPLESVVEPPSASERMEALERILAWGEAEGILLDGLLPD